MKIYITKPPHTKYGRIKLNTYDSIDDLIENSMFWMVKPTFTKPMLCFLSGEFGWSGFSSDYQAYGKIKNFPEGQVKDYMKKMIRDSIHDDFYESFNNRHYKWIGEFDVDLISSPTPGNFNLYLTKPDPIDIQVAGIDRATLWFYKPTLKREVDLYTQKTLTYNFDGAAGIKGKYFRKYEKELSNIFWKEIVNSFDCQFNDMDEFYKRINNKNHKKGQSSKKFVKEYYFNLNVRGDK